MLLKTISHADKNSWNLFCHARTETFFFDDQKDNGEGIVITNKNGEFTTLFTYVSPAVRTASVKYVAYFERIGETPRNNKSFNTRTSAYWVCFGSICLSTGETIKRGGIEGLV